jgi:hypothetical protein
VRSVEFHPEAQDEFISAAQFDDRETRGLGLEFISTVQHKHTNGSRSRPRARHSAAGSGVFSSQSFRTVSCTASSLTVSTSSRSCTFTDAQATGGHGSERTLPTNRLERSGSTPAAHPARSPTAKDVSG